MSRLNDDQAKRRKVLYTKIRHGVATQADAEEFRRIELVRQRDTIAKALENAAFHERWLFKNDAHRCFACWNTEGYSPDGCDLPNQVNLLFAVLTAKAEIDNGGLVQLLTTDLGVVTPEASDGFVAMGFLDLAQILRDTCNLFGLVFPRDVDVRIRYIPDIKTHLDRLESAFFRTSKTIGSKSFEDTCDVFLRKTIEENE